jgi:glutamyl-tRNA synthetase
LANVVDDHLMAITHVIRAEEWISSTPKHVLLYKMFGWDIPEFAHLPLLLNTDRSKLSKRQNDVSVSDYQEQGYLPEALVNFISLLGWNPGTDQEVFSIESLIEHFDLKKVHKAGAVFNREKLDWLNGAYIREMADNDYFAHAQKYLPAFIFGKFENTYIQNVINLEKTRIKKFNELAELVSNFFVDELEYEVEMLKWRKGDLAEAKERLTFMVSYLSDTDLALTPDNYEAIEETIKADIKAKDLGMGNTLWPLRVALSGREHSPSPFELLSVLGKEKSIERIQHAIAKLA